MARDPIAKMGQRVREEGTPEKVCCVVVPAHKCLPSEFHFLRISA
jgi:hypothetical protein